MIIGQEVNAAALHVVVGDVVGTHFVILTIITHNDFGYCNVECCYCC